MKLLWPQVKRWASPPVFTGDDDKTCQARLVHHLLLAVASFVPVLIVGNLLGGQSR